MGMKLEATLLICEFNDRVAATKENGEIPFIKSELLSLETLNSSFPSLSLSLSLSPDTFKFLFN